MQILKGRFFYHSSYFSELTEVYTVKKFVHRNGFDSSSALCNNHYIYNHYTILDIIKKLIMCFAELKWLNSFLLFVPMVQSDSWLKMNEILEI